MFDQVIGHKAQKKYLQTVFEKKEISHAYSFSGPESLGKFTIAKEFAANLVQVEVGALQGHPDITIVQSEENSISVEEIRKLREHLRLSSLTNSMKVAIINQAQKMTIAAQNALLKTLEEPSRDTVMILVADSNDSLLSTIRSRCVQLNFTRTPSKEIESQLIDRGAEQSQAQQITNLAHGRPGVAINLMDAEKRAQALEELDAAKSFLALTQAEKIAMAGKVIKDADSKDELLKVVHNWKAVLHDALVVSSESELIKLARALNACLYAISAIKRNVSPNLAIEYFILRI